MAKQNLAAGSWQRAEGTYFSASTGVSSSQSVLHSIIIGTYTVNAGFRLVDGTLTSDGTFTASKYMSGTFIPNSLQLPTAVEFKELEFETGLVVLTQGTINLSVIYNTL